LNGECIKKVLGEMVCENGVYNEGIIRDRINRLQVFEACILLFYKKGSQEKMLFQKVISLLHSVIVDIDRS